jgi:homoserine dehydrogenase
VAEKNQVALNFEAAVGGAIPIVKTLREGLAGNSLARIYGILNGTCNYILTRMEQEKLAFADCLKEAQRLGYAEADPTFDIEGHDTAQKLAILASLAFGIKVDQSAVYVEGISSIASEDLEWADELGYRVKLLGVAVRTDKGIEQRVHPTMVPKDTAIAQVMGVTNAVTLDADASRRSRWSARAPAEWRRVFGRFRYRRHRPRRAHAPFGRPTGRLTVSRKRRCNATRAATTSVCWRWTNRAPPPPSPSASRSRTSRSSRSSSVTAASGPHGGEVPDVRPNRCR